MSLSENINNDPDGVLNNEDKMREVIADPDLAVQLLEAKNEYNMTVYVDGVKVALVRPIQP